MVAPVFLLVITVVFASVLALEGGDEHFAKRPAGLLLVGWLAPMPLAHHPSGRSQPVAAPSPSRLPASPPQKS